MEKNCDLRQKAKYMSKWFRSYYNEMDNFIADLQEGILTYNDENLNTISDKFDNIQRLSLLIQEEFENIQKLGEIKLR